MDTRQQKPLIVIVGPTASGKTSLAIQIAKDYDGEIICADSRTVYKGMDIGTAKPTPEDQARVKHWGINLVEPGERYTAGQFKEYALGKIADIRSRGKLPILVGGTGLYVDGIILNYEFTKTYNRKLRDKFKFMTVEELQNYCAENNITLPTNGLNKRHLIGAIERKSIRLKRQSELIHNSIVVGIATNKHDLHARIKQRAEQLFNNEVVEEATRLGKKYGWNSEAMTGNIYPIIRLYLKNEITLDKAVELFTTSDRQLAKRQMTWFRANPYIEWTTLTEAKDYLRTVLASE